MSETTDQELFEEPSSIFYRTNYENITDTITDHVIVLDLDETLVHVYENKLSNVNILSDPNLIDLKERLIIVKLFDVDNDSEKGTGSKVELWGVTRPNLDQFISFLFKYFKLVIVWSAGQRQYVDEVVNFIFRHHKQPHVVFSRNECDKKGVKKELHKPLKKMINMVDGLSTYMKMSNCLIVDDRIENFIANPTNGVLIPAYSPEPEMEAIRADDTYLLQLQRWFETHQVRTSKDLRKLLKSEIFEKSRS